MSNRSLVIASLIGTLLQLGMVVAGHSNPAIKGLFAVGGIGLSLIAGVLYARLARATAKGNASIGGPLGALAFGRAAAAAGVALLLATSAPREMRAQATTSVAKAAALHGDTTATLRDFTWLTGRWEGTVGNLPGATLEVMYSAPRAGLMTGVMRLVQRDTVLVVELISLVESPHGVEMRFRHFSPTLDAYEREFKQTMRLTSHQPGADLFENTIPFDAKLMSTQPRRTSLVRHGDDEFVGRSDIIGSDGKPAEIVSTYRRVR